MVKIFSSPGIKTNRQHDEIIEWIQSSSNFNDAYVFLEFRWPGKGSRDVDMLILKPDAFFLLELKRDQFTKIDNIGHWYRLDPKTQKEEPYTHRVKGEYENPFQQAEHTSDALKKWIRRKKMDITLRSNLQKFIDSDLFKIFPIVYIWPNATLSPTNLTHPAWIDLCYGKENLKNMFSRNFHYKTSEAVDFYPDEIESIAELLNLSDLKPFRKGKQNETLMAILQFMYHHNPKWQNIELIRDEVFASGEKRKAEVRKAILRGKKDKVIEQGSEGLILTNFFIFFVKNLESVKATYSQWGDITLISKIHLNRPILFSIFANYQYNIEKTLSTERDARNITSLVNIPKSLLIFTIDSILKIDSTGSPQFFREGGIQWVDYNHHYYTPFINQFGFNLVDDIIVHISLNQSVWISGKGATGKSTLSRITALKLYEQDIPVIFLLAADFDAQVYESLMDYANEVKSENNPKFITILEDVHLYSPNQLLQLQKLLTTKNPPELIITSRISPTDLFSEELTKKNMVEIDLNQTDLLENRMALLIRQVLHTHKFKLDKAKENEVVKALIEQTQSNFILLQIELEILHHIDNSQEATFFWRSANHEQMFDDQLNRYIESKISIYASDFADLEHQIRILFFLNAVFAYLEIPLQQHLIHKFSGISQEVIYQLYTYWERRNEFSLTESIQNFLHPELAEKIIKSLPNSYLIWKEIKEELQTKLHQPEKISFLDHVRSIFIDHDPRLLIQMINRATYFSKIPVINYSKIKLIQFVDYTAELTLEDYYLLIEHLQSTGNHWTAEQWWHFFQELYNRNLTALIQESESVKAIRRLLEIIYQTKWPHFSQLIEQFTTSFFVNLLKTESEQLFSMMRDLHRWNYSRRIIVEKQYILNQILEHGQLHDPSYQITQISFNLIDNLDPSHVIENIKENPRNLRKLFQFLNSNASRFGTHSQLRMKILALILKDMGKIYAPMIFLEGLFCISPSMIKEHSEIREIMKNWDQEHLHKLFLTLEAGWFRFFLEQVEKWKIPELNSFLTRFSLENIIKIWNNPSSEEYDTYFALDDFLLQLSRHNWVHFAAFLESFGIDYYLSKLNPKKIIEHGVDYANIRLLKILLTSEWPSKSQFQAQFPFLEYGKALGVSTFHFLRNSKILVHFHQSEALMQYYFMQCQRREEQYYLSEIIEYCNSHNYPWQDWIEYSDLYNSAQDNSYEVRKLIQIFQHHGWNIPQNLEKKLSEIQAHQKENFLAKLTFLERARHIYPNQPELSLQLYSEVVNSLNLNPDFEQLQDFLYSIRSLNEPDKHHLVNQLQDDAIQTIFIDNWNDFHRAIHLIQILDEQGFARVDLIIIRLYLQITQSYENIFWQQIFSNPKIHVNCSNIWNILWEQQQFYKLSRLPEQFEEIHRQNQELMTDFIYSSLSPHSYLWQLYLKTISHTKDKTQEILRKVLLLDFTFDHIIQIIQEFPNQKEIVPMFLESSPEIWKIRLQRSSPAEICRFLDFIDNDNQIEQIKHWLMLFSTKEWAKIFQEAHSDLKETFNLYYQKFLGHF